MPVDVHDVMELLSTISNNKGLKVTMKQSVKGGVIAGVSTAIGGLVAGPPGLAAGKIYLYEPPWASFILCISL